MDFPIDEWNKRAEAVKQRFYPSTGRSRLAGNAMAELDPEFAELIQVVARGRAYADPTLDLKTRALCTVACLVAIGEQRYVENWIANSMNVGATKDEIVELMVQLFVYIGTPRAVTGFEAAKAVFSERGIT
ncbi:MAG: carboxymuconolactone decarboxylase family protein [Actinobacteria bacterium]|jgi:4-carboxymuconolactone decarboxylase|nr:MAG: carboxymuconolactone decarboxylase family protein [Actinomycetota bacterium]